MQFGRRLIFPSPSVDQGVIGATTHIIKDEHGEGIMNGPEAFPGEEEDYRVSGPLDADFIASGH